MHARRKPQQQSSTGSQRQEAEPIGNGHRATPFPPRGRLTPATLSALQRTLGNAAVARLVAEERADEQADDRSAMAEVDTVTRRPGSSLRADVRRTMEHDFGGEDFSDVRLHVDRVSAEAVGAKAYTTKTHHIVFRSTADMDDHTVRHELEHVRQQRAGHVPPGVSHPEDPLEREAESTATRLGRGSPGLQRVAAPGHRHAPVPTAADTVQRVRATDQTFWTLWAGAGVGLTPTEKNWVWQKLSGLARPRRRTVGSLSAQEAVDLLTEGGVTPDAMRERMEQAAREERAQHEQNAKRTVEAAGVEWQREQPQLPTLTTVAFDIEGMGRGTVALLTSPEPKHRGMLSWFSHGYQDRFPITIDTARTYGFAVRKEQSLNRIAGTPEDWTSLPDALAGSGIAPTTSAPGAYVQPHAASELTQQISRVTSLVGDCDVAVLLDYQWADRVAEEHGEARAANTPALPVIIDRTPALATYTSLLIYACRTPWGVNAAAEGSSLIRSAYVRELKAAGKGEKEATEMAEERYTGGPVKGVVHGPEEDAPR